MSEWFSGDGAAAKAAASAVVILAAVLVRVLLGRLIRRQRWAAPDDARRWVVQVRNATLLLVAFGLVVVWADQLRTAALTIVAFAAALVLATRELITSVTGSIARATSGSFVVGDRIRLGDLRGVVIDHSLLVTTMLEIGPGHVRTGRTVVFPNSLLLTQAVINETRGHDYVLHSFVVPVQRSHWAEASEILREAAEEASAPYLEEARREMKETADKYALTVPLVDPFVLVKPTAPESVELTVRMPVPIREAWRVEATVIRAWLDRSADDPDRPIVIDGAGSNDPSGDTAP